jgi:hypothetical protein
VASRPCTRSTSIPATFAALGRSLADFGALEAQVYLRHSQLVDVLQYLDPGYIAAPCSAGRACEYVLNLLDVINRLQGGNVNTRYSPPGKEAMVAIGTPVEINDIRTPGRKERLAGSARRCSMRSRRLQGKWKLPGNGNISRPEQRQNIPLSTIM